MRARGCARACSTGATRLRACGRTRPIARRPMRRSWKRTASSAAFIARNQREDPAMPRRNAAKSKIRSYVEHVFAEQKDRMNLFVRTIRIARAKVKIGMANLVYNFQRLIFLQRRVAA